MVNIYNIYTESCTGCTGCTGGKNTGKPKKVENVRSFGRLLPFPNA